MWYHTPITKRLGIQYPILQGPFGGKYSTVELLAAVSNLGGLGGFGAYTLTPAEIAHLGKDIRKVTDKPYNLNLWVTNSDVPSGGVSDSQFDYVKAVFRPYFMEVGIDFPEKPIARFSSFEDQVQVVLDLRPAVFSFIFGIPSADILQECRRKGIVTAGGATTLDEALALEAAGVDWIVASGFEAGGHRPSFLAPAENSFIGTFVLVQQIKDRVRVPVVAAGGIATGRGIAAALALGADGVQVGTAYLACEESGAQSFHRQLLLSDAGRYTAVTRSFTGRWGRGLANRVCQETKGIDQEILPFPLQSSLMSHLRKAAIEQEKWDLILNWSGQVAPLLTHRKVSDLMEDLVSATTDYFNHFKS